MVGPDPWMHASGQMPRGSLACTRHRPPKTVICQITAEAMSSLRCSLVELSLGSEGREGSGLPLLRRMLYLKYIVGTRTRKEAITNLNKAPRFPDESSLHFQQSTVNRLRCCTHGAIFLPNTSFLPRFILTKCSMERCVDAYDQESWSNGSVGTWELLLYNCNSLASISKILVPVQSIPARPVQTIAP